MLCLNIRQTLPQIGIRNRLSTLSAHMVQPVAHSEYKAPHSNQTMKQATIEIDSYPSRKSYGARKDADLVAEWAQKGYSDVRSSTSGHAQKAWSFIDNAAKQGVDEVVNQAKGEISSAISKKRYIEAQDIPDPIVRGVPAELSGDIDPGYYRWNVDVQSTAEVNFNRGSVEIYMKQEADLRQWVTEDHYDIYA